MSLSNVRLVVVDNLILLFLGLVSKSEHPNRRRLEFQPHELSLLFVLVETAHSRKLWPHAFKAFGLLLSLFFCCEEIVEMRIKEPFLDNITKSIEVKKKNKKKNKKNKNQKKTTTKTNPLYMGSSSQLNYILIQRKLIEIVYHTFVPNRSSTVLSQVSSTMIGYF